MPRTHSQYSQQMNSCVMFHLYCSKFKAFIVLNCPSYFCLTSCRCTGKPVYRCDCGVSIYQTLSFTLTSFHCQFPTKTTLIRAFVFPWKTSQTHNATMAIFLQYLPLHTTPYALTHRCSRAIQTNEPYYCPCPLHGYVKHNATKA